MCLTTHFLRPCGLGCQCGEGERLCELGVLVYLETDHFLDTSRHVPFIPRTHLTFAFVEFCTGTVHLARARHLSTLASGFVRVSGESSQNTLRFR